MKVEQFVAEELFRRGVKYVFGIPGGSSIPYMSECKKAGIEFILTSNETSAAIMADVTGRLTGIPGVCHATLGPGATNLSTGLGGALLDRSPVIAFISEVNTSMSKRTTQMNIDHYQLLEPVTKAGIRLTASGAPEIINDSFDLALSEYPGPVHIGLPSDLAGKVVKNTEVTYRSEEWDQEIILDSEVTSLLEYSKKPVLAIGLSAARSRLSEELISFLEKHPIPVVITPMAKGLIPEDHSCYAGVLFHALSDKLDAITNDADLIIGFGYDPIEYNYEDWIPDVPLIHFDTVKTDMPRDIMAKQVIGSLEGLTEIVSACMNSGIEWDLKSVKKTRELIREPLQKDSLVFGPVSLLKLLNKKLPVETIFTLDVGSHIHLFGQLWSSGLNDNLIMTNGWSGMGFAIPAAIAASLNSASSHVVCVTGDGGFLMTAGELITARRYNLNIIFVVLSDNELNLIKLKQEKIEADIYGINLYDNSLFQSDKFLGIPVISADSTDSFNNSIDRAMQFAGPVIIEARIDPSDYKKYVIV